MSPRPGWPYDREFACHRCGNCCRGSGYVSMSAEDIANAARHIGVPVPEFKDTYCRELPEDLVVLRDQGDAEQSCVFLTPENTCRVHGSKPKQCRDFPFHWRPDNVLEFCEGMRAIAGLPPGGKPTMSRE
ncbi:MAG: YkgJ family cysteine cluster protein [Candidatus Sumerlaeia bacterium]|nr:YkgJ family cysteine cluster protein [Candidatus Sumerlaeia bacterium]